MESGQNPWKFLYGMGGVAALIAVFVFRRNLGAELTAFRGFGIFNVPETMPAQAADWFALLQRDKFVGLALFEAFDLIEYAMVGLIFLALYTALRHIKPGATLTATTCGLVGIAVYFASNQAFAMLSLSEKYAAAATEAQRAVFLAAGEALLALQQGTGIYLSLFLVLLAGLIISVVMLKSQIFSNAAAVAGILANGFGLAYYPVLIFAPGLVALPFVLSAPFRMVWYFLIAVQLFKLGRS